MAEILWAKCESLARKLPGDEAVRCLSRASRKVYAARIDQLFAKYALKLTDADTERYDIGWLTCWAAELAEAVNKRRKT